MKMSQEPETTSLHESPVAQLYQLHAPALLIYLRRHLASQEDAEDLLLEVFIAAVEKQTLASMNIDQQRAWLQQVAHNKMVDHHRSQARRPAVALQQVSETHFYDDTALPEQVLLRQEEQTRLHERLASLPALQQEVLWLRFAYGLRTHEIAQRLNRSDAAIRMVLSRALNFLRTIYSRTKEDEHG